MQRNFPSVIKVVNNAPKDTEPPKLLNFKAITPTKMDLSSGPTSVTFQVVVQDDIAGFEFGEVSAVQPSANPKFLRCPGRSTQFGRNLPPNGGKPLTFNVTVDLDGCEANTYVLGITLVDTVRNRDYIDNNKLATRGFVANVTLVE
jgi:hypothetical protein